MSIEIIQSTTSRRLRSLKHNTRLCRYKAIAVRLHYSTTMVECMNLLPQTICHARCWIRNSYFRYGHKTNLVSYSLPPFPDPFFYPRQQIPSPPYLTPQSTNPTPPTNRLLEQKLLILHNRAKTAFTHQFSPMFTPTTSSPAPSPAATPIAAALASVELIALTADGAYALGLAEEGF
jgi:hypothetical protein